MIEIEPAWEEDIDRHTALAAAGFGVGRRTLVVQRELDGVEALADPPFAWRTTPPDPQLLARFGAPAGLEAKIAELPWQIASVDGVDVGLVVVRAPSDTGGFAFFGVAPSHRGRGLGRAMHAAALVRLAAAGVTTYVDETDLDNAGMQRIFEQNECHPVGVLCHYAQLGSAAPDRLRSFGDLLRWLRFREIAHVARAEQPVARLPTPVGGRPSDLTVRWSTGNGIVQISGRCPWIVDDLDAAALDVTVRNTTIATGAFILDEARREISFRTGELLDPHDGLHPGRLAYHLRRTAEAVRALDPTIWSYGSRRSNARC